MQGASISSTNARSVVKSSVLRGIINRIDVNKDKVTNGKTAKEIMDLKAIEEELERGAKSKDGMNREETAAVCYLWIVLALAYKKESDYKHCYQVLTNVRRAERALNATPLDQAVTEVNLGTCLFFQREFGEALKHSTSAKDLLVQEIKIAGQEHTQAPPAYKRKLLMNLVLAYFNRAVQYYALGDMEAYKVNINQSLELATQKFGKEESVTRTITGLLESKDKRELKPFFVNKTTDVNGLIKIDNRELISYRDIFVDPNSQLDRAAKERAKIMKERLEKKERIEEKEREREMAAKSSKYSRANSTNKQILSPVESTIEPKRSNSVSPIEVNAIKGGGTRGDSTTASGGPTTKTLMQDDDEIPMNRSKPMSKKMPMSDLGANSNLAFTSAESAKKTSSSASSYPLNRLSVALKYMKLQRLILPSGAPVMEPGIISHLLDRVGQSQEETEMKQRPPDQQAPKTVRQPKNRRTS